MFIDFAIFKYGVNYILYRMFNLKKWYTYKTGIIFIRLMIMRYTYKQ